MFLASGTWHHASRPLQERVVVMGALLFIFVICLYIPIRVISGYFLDWALVLLS